MNLAFIAIVIVGVGFLGAMYYSIQKLSEE